jgi:membrane-associated phospholipid phosphatase
LTVGYFVGGYLFINWINQFQTHYFNVSFPFEWSITFIPVFIFGYILVYFSMVLLYFVLTDMQDFRRAVVACLLTTTVYYILFLIFPVRCELRPDLSHATGFSVNVTKFYYAIDKPYNLFPSLHMAYPTLATLLSWRRHRVMRYIFLAMTLIIGASVVLVKQHYVMDVVVGSLGACLLYFVVLCTEPHWTRWFALMEEKGPASLQKGFL